jgi:7,8-dihydropterin-6-yl-methyl-4-(beta-D-ribofuranosyl)aminobenzene 5'-phosphate synthase
MSVTLTTLSENTSGRPGFMAEWGQSILVQTNGCTVLFDVGASPVPLVNADRLGIDLTKIGISHCNGFYTSARVAQAFSDKFFLNNAGTQITLP